MIAQPTSMISSGMFIGYESSGTQFLLVIFSIVRTNTGLGLVDEIDH